MDFLQNLLSQLGRGGSNLGSSMGDLFGGMGGVGKKLDPRELMSGLGGGGSSNPLSALLSMFKMRG